MAGCVQRVSTITTAATNSQNAMSIMTAIASPAVLARTRRSGSVILSPSSASTKHLTAAEGSEPQRPMGGWNVYPPSPFPRAFVVAVSLQ